MVKHARDARFLKQEINIAGSSNGRTTDSGSVYLGSNPSPAAHTKNTHFRGCFWYARARVKDEKRLSIVYKWSEVKYHTT